MRVFACLTVHPGHYDTLPEGLPQQGHTTGRVVVKQLEHIHPSLRHRQVGTERQVWTERQTGRCETDRQVGDRQLIVKSCLTLQNSSGYSLV